MLDALLENKPKIKITIFYPPKQRAILDFLLNKLQKRSFPIMRIDFLCRLLSLFKNNGVFYPQGVHSKFHYQKKNIVKIRELIDNKKLIKCRNKITLDNKLIHPNSITTIRQKIEYMIFMVIFNERSNKQFRGKLNLLGYKVLELKIICLGKILLESFKESDLKLFNKVILRT